MVCAVDTNVLVDLFDGSSEFSEYARMLFNNAESGAIRLIGSQIVLAEILSKPMDESLVNGILTDTKSLAIVFEPVTMADLLQAAQIRRLHKLTLPDAIHIATAMRAGATHFLTNDRKILNKPLASIALTPITQVASLLAA